MTNCGWKPDLGDTAPPMSRTIVGAVINKWNHKHTDHEIQNYHRIIARPAHRGTPTAVSAKTPKIHDDQNGEATAVYGERAVGFAPRLVLLFLAQELFRRGNVPPEWAGFKSRLPSPASREEKSNVNASCPCESRRKRPSGRNSKVGERACIRRIALQGRKLSMLRLTGLSMSTYSIYKDESSRSAGLYRRRSIPP